MGDSASVSLFSLPLPRWQRPVSYRTAKYDPPRRAKRSVSVNTDGSSAESDSDRDKRADSGNDADENDQPFFSRDNSRPGSRAPSVKSDHLTFHSSASTRPSSRASSAAATVLRTPDEAHQYRIAGLPFDSELPGGNFPHSEGRKEKKAAMKKETEKELAQLNPPVFLPGSARHTLRLKHLGVITAILHRCLLEGDYVRAGRAWGLILRDEWSGHAIDVRTEGRWGIGAEILLWRDKQLNGGFGVTNDDADGANNNNKRRGWFTRTGFEKAKQYYERLILHYPYRKHTPNALGPLDFYPAMFGLWISLVQEESRSARETPIDSERDETDSYGYDYEYDPEDRMSISSDKEDRRRAEIIARARAKELEEAQQIASQLDDILVSPPYSDSYELLRLRGMISLWIGDLSVSSVSPDEAAAQGLGTWRDAGGDSNMMSFEDDMKSILARMEEGLSVERKRAEVEKAKEFFQRAKARKVGPLSDVDKRYMDNIESY